MAKLIDGRYEVVRQLGSGSMGVVFLAEDVFLGRRVAIKLIDPVHAADPATTERFVKEARALAQVRHSNVVQVYAFGPHEDSFFFAMEYVKGRPLEELVDAGETSETSRSIEIIRAVASGLDAVHAQKLVHRDVKPSNIVIEEETGRPVLIDFGLARKKSVSNPRLSITAGTPSYMAPEQASDPDGTRVTNRADIYALAASAYELLTGRPVFDGRDIFEVLQGHLKRVPLPISSRRADLVELDLAFAKALAKDPLQRHATAGEFSNELDEAWRRREHLVRVETLPPPASSVRTLDGPTERVIILTKEDSFVKQVSRVVRRSLGGVGRNAEIVQVRDGKGLLESFAKASASIVVVDDDAVETFLAELVHRLRMTAGGATASIVVVSRLFTSVRSVVAELGVRDVLPKPLSVHMLQSAIERVVMRRSVDFSANT